MPADTMTATLRMTSSTDSVFAVLTDPARHAEIDGTGWVCAAVDRERLTGRGQRFRMGMFHPDHPDRSYEMTNEVAAFDAPHAVAWRPGYVDDGGVVRFGGWVWRYDLEQVDADTADVALTYDWSAATPSARKAIGFPPSGVEHLDNSLAHLARLAAAT